MKSGAEARAEKKGYAVLILQTKTSTLLVVNFPNATFLGNMY